MIAARKHEDIEPDMITELESPFTRMPTQYGFIQFGRWVELERERLAAKGTSARVHFNGGGRVCLVRTDKG